MTGLGRTIIATALAFVEQERGRQENNFLCACSDAGGSTSYYCDLNAPELRVAQLSWPTFGMRREGRGGKGRGGRGREGQEEKKHS